MKYFSVILDIIIWVLPILTILLGLYKKNKKKKVILFNYILRAVIFFLIFYIVKVGGISLLDKVNSNKEIKTTNITSDIKIISTTSIDSKIENIETTTTKITTNNSSNIKYVDGILIVNKSYPLPRDFIPKNTYKSIEGLNYCSECIDVDAYNQFKLMKSDATSLGLNIWIQSGYRSYELQTTLYNNYVNRDGKLAADTYSARPGHSEHQTGLAFDLNTITDDFQYTDEGKWINDNCYKYGFILRYPKDKERFTGYKYESWHLRYVGIELATKLYNNGDWITLEEHFNLTSNYTD